MNVALRPDLGKLKKIIYFHENQMEFPNRVDKERDVQLSWIQIVSSFLISIFFSVSVLKSPTKRPDPFSP